MHPLRRKFLRIVILPVYLSGAAPAAILASYDFASGSQSSSASPVSATATSFSGGAGLAVRNDGTGTVSGTPGYSQGHARANAAYVAGNGTVAGTEAAAYDLNEYFTFGIQPAAGNVLNLETLTFDTSYYDSDIVSYATFFVRSSLDGFQSNIGPSFVQVLQTPATFNSRSVDLTGAAFQGITGNVDFRIYLYDTNNNAARWIALDNVVLSGSTAVIPEPSSAAVFFCAATCALLGRRKR